jgi:hypothetical protein
MVFLNIRIQQIFVQFHFRTCMAMSAPFDLSNKEMMKNYSRYLFLHGTGISQYKGTVSQDLERTE